MTRKPRIYKIYKHYSQGEGAWVVEFSTSPQRRVHFEFPSWQMCIGYLACCFELNYVLGAL